jgi:hypothetical protein
MRLETAEYRVTKSEEHGFQEHDGGQTLLTPARRAALDALEREFRDLLAAHPR